MKGILIVIQLIKSALAFVNEGEPAGHNARRQSAKQSQKLWRWSALLLLLCILPVNASEAAVNKPQRLALLIISPREGEVATMHNDIVAVHDALRLRGFSAKEILSLEGQLDRRSFMSFLQKAGKRVAKWRQGEIFFYFGGHGMFTGTTVSEARPGLWLKDDLQMSAESTVFWDEVFAALNAPANVKVVLLPDN
jgi:hypothetical protein